MLGLFLLFLRVGLLSFGGGNAAMPYIEHEVVTGKKWLTKEEFYELLAVTNSLPGPNMIQVCGYIGKKQFGFIGMIVATFSMLLPPTFLFTFAVYYGKDYIDPEVMKKLTTGAIWFIMALLINLTYRLVKSSFKSPSNNYGFVALFIMSMSLIMIRLNTALVITINIFSIFIFSMIFNRNSKLKFEAVEEAEKEVVEND